MDLTEFYRQADKNNWIGRKDGPQKERFFQIIELENKEHFAEVAPFTQQRQAVIVGFASDEGVFRNQGRLGASLGPQVLRKALGNLPLSANLLDNFSLRDVGDIVCANNDLEQAQILLGKQVESITEKDALPIVFGGGHELAYGHYLGLHPKLGQKNMAIVNFDAHFDMRPLLKNQLGSSGTPFLQIAELRKKANLPFHYYCLGIKDSSNTLSLFQTAKEWNVQYLRCDDMIRSPNHTHDFLTNIINQHDVIYVTICLDVFAASVAPGVSAAAPFGLDPFTVIQALRLLAQSGKVIALDIAELAPNFDRDNITAKLAAVCVAEFLYGWKGRPL